MSSPRYQPILAADDWFAGEDQDFTPWTIYDDQTNLPKDITGWTIQFKLATAQGAAATLTKSATLVTPASGICKVSIAAADTTALATANPYFYTLSRVDTGNNQVLAYGPAVLQARPT